MVREIMKDPIFLAQKSQKARAEDLPVAQDLLETLIAHADGCVGMAANMIGVNKCIIAFNDEGSYTLMLNPVIKKFSGAYETEEGCLSLPGVRPCRRYKTIKVEYETLKLEKRIKTYTGYTAQIIQHEIDHTNGILI
ncbi:MAG: peptide deformylase [Oscillospiraceae bacterium]|nr:peptide deformylase [Oscillospiraceae bacterium]